MNAHALVTDADGLRALVARQLGLAFEDDKHGLLAELVERRCKVRRIGSVAEYLERLGAGWPDELSAIAPELTVGETFFFRNPDQFRALGEFALPARLQARAAGRRLRILSAGCASGEEAYSLAILLNDQRLAASGWTVEVVGVDLNTISLTRARRARYSAWSLRETPTDVRERHFVSHASSFELAMGIREMVRFEERNLLRDDPAFWQPGTFDVIFCRNVIMYFTPAAARVVVARLARALAPGGFLFLGHAETLRGLSDEFDLCHTHDAFYYRRKTEAGRPEFVEIPAAVAAEAPESAAAWPESIMHAADRIAALAERREVRRRADTPIAPIAATGAIAGVPVIARALELVDEERFVEAMDLLRDLPPPTATSLDTHLLRAALHTNSGAFDEAERICRQLLEIDAGSAGAHYLLALCREQAGDTATALDHDRTAVFLDPGFAMPHLHLGVVARRAGNLETARRELEQAHALLSREEPARILLFGGGFSRRVLVELCRAELAGCGRGT